MPRFLALVGRQKVLCQLTLPILLELFLIMLPYLFGSLFSKLKSHNGKLGTCLSIVLYLVEFYEGTKLEVGAEIDLICRYCRGMTGLNMIAFTGNGAGNVRNDLSATKDIVNIEITENLLYFLCDDRREDKLPSGVTDSFGGETFLNIFFRRLGL